MSINSADEFPPLRTLVDAWRTIRDECVRLDRDSVLSITRSGKRHEEVLAEIVANGKNGWMYGWGPTVSKWRNYGFCHNDTYYFGDAGCPETTRLLSRIRGFKVAALSLFQPGCHLMPHRHPELAIEGMLTFHLGLQVPEDYCYLNVDGEFVKHADGAAFVFDGSKNHFAFNFSTSDRLVLYAEFSRDSLRLC